jgi:Protein of unknown function (DUF2933)
MSTAQSTRRVPSRTAVAIALCVFLAIAAYFLWAEHRAHVMGALPYLLLLSCPIIHLLMHRSHGHQDGHENHGRTPQ